MMTLPKAAAMQPPEGFAPKMPAEWAHHQATWTAWPHDADEWGPTMLPRAQKEVAALIAAIAATGDPVELLVPDATSRAQARDSIGPAGAQVRFHEVPYGDIWLRDTAPIFVHTPDGLEARVFEFNGWGGKYVFPGDEAVGTTIAQRSGVPYSPGGFVLEGGSIDVDGEGRCLTTRQCLRNANRNPHLDTAALEALLQQNLGINQVIWLGDGLVGDHTDGHVDNVARFVAPGVVAVMEAQTADDPHAAVLRQIRRDVETAGLTVEVVPSPGLVHDAFTGKVAPASSMNFYVTNGGVIVPLYGSQLDDAILRRFEFLFPKRRVIGLEATAVLTGGGSFHCITQQQPATTEASLIRSGQT